MSRRSVKLATWPSAWTPASVRPAPCDRHVAVVELAKRVLEQALDGRAGGLPLPADKPAAVIRKGDLEVVWQSVSPAHRRGRRAGLHDRHPCAHSGQRLGLVGRQRDVEQRRERHVEPRGAAAAIDDRRGADHLARPPLSPPASSRASIRRSSARLRRRARDRSATSVKPRRSVSTPSWRSAKIARTPSARPTSWPMTTPPSAGDSTTVGAPDRACARRSRGRAPRRAADAAARARTAGSRGCAARR